MMTFLEYVEAARRFETGYADIKVEIPSIPDARAHVVLHCALGLLTEQIELRRSLSDQAKLEELGDICWFAGIAAHELKCPPDLSNLNGELTIGLGAIEEWIEDFGSSIKAAIAYGSPVRKSHPDAGYWRRLPAVIFRRAVAMGNCRTVSGCILTENIAKLQKRYGDKFTAAAAIARVDQ